MVDMSQFIAAKSDQLNADDLMDSPRTITITKVTAQPDAAEQPVSIHYEGGEGRPWKPCKTMRRILVGVWGKDASKYVGRSMTLYRDPTVAFGGLQVGGIRVSHMSHISEDKTVALLVTRGRKAPFKIKPLVTAPLGADEQTLALKAITDAAAQGTEALANAWKQKWMAPHREALQLDLDRLKAVATGNDPADQRQVEPDSNVNDSAAPQQDAFGLDLGGQPHPAVAKADAIIAEIKEANAIIDVNSIMARHAADIDAMPEDIAASIYSAADQRKQAIDEARVRNAAATREEEPAK